MTLMYNNVSNIAENINTPYTYIIHPGTRIHYTIYTLYTMPPTRLFSELRQHPIRQVLTGRLLYTLIFPPEGVGLEHGYTYCALIYFPIVYYNVYKNIVCYVNNSRNVMII